MDFSLIITKPIAELLIGNETIFEDYTMPYLSGPDLCALCSNFGLPRTYSWSGGSCSRWEYMIDLMKFLNKQDRMNDLLSYLFELENFTQLVSLGDVELITTKHSEIVKGVIKKINGHLVLAKKELRLLNDAFIIANIGEGMVFEAPIIKGVTCQYIRELPERIKGDVENKDFDSVVTKSRTLLEEVLIYIIENQTKKEYKSSGDLNKIYQEVTEMLNMRQNGDWDKRVNELLGGLHKMVSAISGMRNIGSDAHGVGTSRINIKEREARLIAQSSMLLAEYWLSVYEKR